MKRVVAATVGLTIAIVMSCGGSVALGPCASGELVCGGTCLDVQSDNAHCGDCTVRCGDTEHCVKGQCRPGCAPNETACAGHCVDLTTDPSSCGACGNACGDRVSCIGGVCGDRCAKGQLLCGDSGPCINAMTDNANCGACGVQCGAGRACVGGTCLAPCEAGASYCGADGGYTCMDTTRDPKNCGRCGHDCLGSTCSGGTCDPVILATNQLGVIEMALDSSNIYWTRGWGLPQAGSVWACALGGCNDAPTALATGRYAPGTVVSDGQSVYWTENYYWLNPGVYSCNKGGCSNQPTLFAQMSYGSREPQMLVIGGSQLYWVDSGQSVMSCPLAGCAGPPQRVGAFATGPLLADANNVYFAYGNGYGYCPSSGCTNPMPFVNVYPIATALDSKNVYFVGSSKAIQACPLGAPCSSPTTTPTATYYPPFASDGVNLYWAENGEIVSCAVSGCNQSPTVVAVNQISPSLLLLDGTSVYWCSAGRIMKVAK